MQPINFNNPSFGMGVQRIPNPYLATISGDKTTLMPKEANQDGPTKRVTVKFPFAIVATPKNPTKLVVVDGDDYTKNNSNIQNYTRALEGPKSKPEFSTYQEKIQALCDKAT